MTRTTGLNLVIRPARYDDCEIIYVWSMDPATRVNSTRADSYSLPEHREWWHRKLNDSHSQIYVLEADGEPVGQCRYGLGLLSDKAEVAISVAPEHRGKGYGRPLLALSESEIRSLWPALDKFVALILPHNLASLRLFASCGYFPVRLEERMEKLHFRYEKRCGLAIVK